MDTTKVPAAERKRPSPLLMGVTVGWAVLFSFLLLTADPPDIGPVRLRSFEDQGHLFGSALLGFLLYLVLTRWGTAVRRAGFIALGISLGFLGALELIQEIRPDRGYQRLDMQLNFLGSVVGIAAAVGADWVRSRRRLAATDRAHRADIET